MAKTFIDFVKDIDDADQQKKEGLIRGFAAQNTSKDLRKFFKDHGYDDIPVASCEELLIAREHLEKVKGMPDSHPCGTSKFAKY